MTRRASSTRQISTDGMVRVWLGVDMGATRRFAHARPAVDVNYCSPAALLHRSDDHLRCLEAPPHCIGGQGREDHVDERLGSRG